MQGRVIVNCRSGGALDRPIDDIVEQIAAGLRADGVELDVQVVDPDQLTDRLRACLSDPPDRLVVAGGDGTLNAAAACLSGSGITIGIIPLGTLNLFAHEFNIPLEPGAAAAGLRDYERVTVDLAEVNGRKFLCNSIMGLPLSFSRQRQQVRGAPIADRLRGYWRALRSVARSRRHLELKLELDDRTESMRVQGLAISNNPYDETPSVLPTRSELDTGCLGVYISRHRGILGLAGMFLRAAVGSWHGDPNFVRKRARAVTITAKRRHLRVSNDGEVDLIKTPLHYRMHAKALCLLLPEQQKSRLAAILPGSAEANDREQDPGGQANS